MQSVTKKRLAELSAAELKDSGKAFKATKEREE